MQTPTHTLLALAVLSKRGDNARNGWIFAGSLMPDAFIYVCWVWLTFIKGESQSRIWDEIYFDAPMQLTGAVFNSAPIYSGLIILALISKHSRWGELMFVFALAALIHIATDIPVHADDAHRHFWPLSDWRFYSPFSYWDVAHHARWVSLVEMSVAFCAITILWFRFKARWVRIVLTALAVFMLTAQITFYIVPALQGS